MHKVYRDWKVHGILHCTGPKFVQIHFQHRAQADVQAVTASVPQAGIAAPFDIRNSVMDRDWVQNRSLPRLFECFIYFSQFICFFTIQKNAWTWAIFLLTRKSVSCKIKIHFYLVCEVGSKMNHISQPLFVTFLVADWNTKGRDFMRRETIDNWNMRITLFHLMT